MKAAWLPLGGETGEPDEPFLERAARWAVELSYREIPKPVRRAAKAQLTSAIGAALWTRTHPLGDRIARAIGTERRERGSATFLGGERLTPPEAARGNAALSGALEFDGRLLGGATSPSCVFVPLAYAEATNAGGRDLLVAQVAANEVTARLGAATAVGPFAGPDAAWMHSAGAAIGRAVLEGDEQGTLADAIAIALTAPSRPIKRSALGSDGGVWMASDAIRSGIAALDSARAGMAGRRDMVEAGDGLLSSVSPRPAIAYLSFLGSRWHTATVSVSAVPGNVYVAAAAEAGLEARSQFDRGRTTIERVDVYGPHAMVSVDDDATPYLDGESPPIAARCRSVTDAVAAALVTGESIPRRFAEGAERAERAAIERVDERIRVHHDSELTLAALRSTATEGVDFETSTGSIAAHVARALGPAAAVRHAPTVARVGRRLAEPPSADDFDRRIGARVVVRTADGRTVEAAVDRPPGTAGAPPAEIRAVARSKCRDAFEALGRSEPEARERTDRLLAIEVEDEIGVDRLLDALDGR